MDRPTGRSTGVNPMPVRAAPNASAQAAFDELYRSSRDDVYAYAAGLLRDRAAAEEVTALAFERAYRKRESFRPERGSHRAWLFGIARNAALDELRRRRRMVVMQQEPAVTDPDPASERGATQRVVLQVALGTLTAREREVITLKFHAGLTNGELARVLGVSETNAGTLLHRTIQKLRKACE